MFIANTIRIFKDIEVDPSECDDCCHLGCYVEKYSIGDSTESEMEYFCQGEAYTCPRVCSKEQEVHEFIQWNQDMFELLEQRK